MPHLVFTQIRLRRAFRYGYFAFLFGAGLALLLLAIQVLNGQAVGLLNFSLADARFWLTVALLILGLCVPLFFACWLLIGSAILSRAPRTPLNRGIAD